MVDWWDWVEFLGSGLHVVDSWAILGGPLGASGARDPLGKYVLTSTAQASTEGETGRQGRTGQEREWTVRVPCTHASCAYVCK